MTSGGAIYVGRGNIAILRDCLFLENKAIADRATSLGGAIDVWGTLSSVQVRKGTTFFFFFFLFFFFFSSFFLRGNR